ncbi:LINE-1 reverse transcriptase isogeny [Gossypium australe]|uniref:LINE-1 reverse transcriptase isogeny n=1 Tax=Gossypium australe TaxID=47621 RepID=A0A5B6VWU2_9ROSI|nr:LINE-1 reverse transcriptase isogeny [Gossypium australe]
MEFINKMNIVLIPKIGSPTNLKDFRLISLCTVLYKIIAKITANHLQKMLESCIDEAQNAFVLGCPITDNVLLAYEAFDANETYNQEGLIRGMKVCRRGPQITHLMFADDCLLFGEVTRDGANVLKGILREYEDISGQRINFENFTTFFSSNITNASKEVVSQMMNMRSSTEPEKYLSLPNIVRDDKRKAFQSLKDKMRAKISGWSIRHLSQGGKEDNYLPILGEAYGPPRAFWRLKCARELVRKDGRAWSGEATGEYTVRSAFKWLIHNHYGISTDGNFYPYSNLYKRLWNIDLPSKIKITTWRIMNNFVSTYANLYYRGLMNSANCPAATVVWKQLNMFFKSVCTQ